MSECGLRECAFDRVAIQQTVIFGYQVCSKKGFVEFPYADDLASSLGIEVSANTTLPGRITIAANGVGGAPSFPILDEDGDRMVFGSAAWKILPEGSILVPALLLTAGFMTVR
ncbi:unnamed protein product [Tuber melanosporum]|uniref:(Perigord truffle) hypothetical protein n=1 Tax=Tuber melanosporum (strain Mel28) TaxID=656061 RepID=D5G7K6_TUBMM|nr:uncharacterized protein GSTUM_00004599001 [Tuber melanosporum]CAZ80499.1 unnamed protein product [Tuber melanosporum]